MEINEAKEKDLQKQLRKEAVKRNWKLFSQSKLGMIGLGIVSVFLILALLQPFLFLVLRFPSLLALSPLFIR